MFYERMQEREETIQLAQKKAAALPPIHNYHWVQEVSTKKSHQWSENIWQPEYLTNKPSKEKNVYPHILVYDCGVKHNILRLLRHQNCRITCVPMKIRAAELIEKYKPQGVLFSNGPGDPDVCQDTINDIAYCLEQNIPLFGICLGHQLLGLACHLRIYKMKFGHHGANHPVKDLDTGRVIITSQNHNFAIGEDSLPDNIRITHRSLFDNSIQGIELTDKPAFSFQGHPEASPGPHDTNYLFNKFIRMASHA